MGSFSRDWLALREPADHAARNRDVLAAVAASFSERPSLSIVDLGSGAGSNLRGCALALPPARQHWTLVDADPVLLTAARERLSAWADRAETRDDRLLLAKDGKTIAVSFHLADLVRGFEPLIPDSTDLVTAAALFDLVSPAWISDVVRLLGARRLPLYTVLTYNGREEWLPPHGADDAMLRAFASHQSRDKGFGPSAGSGAAGLLEELFRAAGYDVRAGESSWHLTASSAELLSQLAEGIASAVSETGDVAANVVSDWLAFRVDRSGGSSTHVTIGHTDLFASPKAESREPRAEAQGA